MKKTPAIAAALTLFSCTGCWFTPRAGISQMEKEQDATFTYLAKRRNMTALRAGGEQLGTIGSVYAVQRPSKKAQLQSYARQGSAIEITPFDPSRVNVPTFVSETTSYQIQNELATYIAAQLQAKLQQQGASTEGFIEQLRKANIRFKVTRLSTWERNFRQALGRDAYTVSDIPDDAAGLVTPMEVLVISEFSHDSVDTSTVEGRFAANYLQQLKGDIVATVKSSGTAGTELTEPRIVAIRPLPLAYRQ